MSWAHAIRRPKIHGERLQTEVASDGEWWLMRRLADAEPAWTPMWDIGGYVASQTVYRLRNRYGPDIIMTLTGRGYRLSKRGLELVVSIDRTGPR